MSLASPTKSPVLRGFAVEVPVGVVSRNSRGWCVRALLTNSRRWRDGWPVPFRVGGLGRRRIGGTPDRRMRCGHSRRASRRLRPGCPTVAGCCGGSGLAAQIQLRRSPVRDADAHLTAGGLHRNGATDRGRYRDIAGRGLRTDVAREPAEVFSYARQVRRHADRAIAVGG
jgi:hypothetical protein